MIANDDKQRKNEKFEQELKALKEMAKASKFAQEADGPDPNTEYGA